jgi:hypothetical protein
MCVEVFRPVKLEVYIPSYERLGEYRAELYGRESVVDDPFKLLWIEFLP